MPKKSNLVSSAMFKEYAIPHVLSPELEYEAVASIEGVLIMEMSSLVFSAMMSKPIPTVRGRPSFAYAFMSPVAVNSVWKIGVKPPA